MGACINKGSAQHQEMEKTSEVFQTVLTDINLKSDIILWILLFWKPKQYDS